MPSVSCRQWIPRIAGALLCAAALAWSNSALASDRTGIYAVIDRVEYFPNKTEPQRVKVEGLFTIGYPKGHPKNGRLSPPAKGYLLLELVKDDEKRCRNEWRDLERVAGTGTVVGFGSRWRALPRLPQAG